MQIPRRQPAGDLGEAAGMVTRGSRCRRRYFSISPAKSPMSMMPMSGSS